MAKISNKMFEYKAHYVTENAENYTVKSFWMFTFHFMQVLLGDGLRKVNIWRMCWPVWEK